MARIEAIAEPSLLVWARERAGYSIEQAAKRVPVTPERLAAWEAGEARPTVKQLRKLGGIYGRPLAVFYLPEPPRGPQQPVRDHRRIWGEEPEGISPRLRKEIDIAEDRRELALELLSLQGEEPPTFELRASIGENPNTVAARFREALGVTLDEQLSWHERYNGFNAWRDAIEGVGALVLQMTDVPVLEARGFSIADRPLPAVVANIKDTPRARCFTLMHELVHVALHEGGICTLDDAERVEVFCNRIAGAVLVPAEALRSDQIVSAHGTEPEWEDREIEALARHFSVSREVVLRRLLIIGRTEQAFYQRKRDEYTEQYREATEQRKREEQKPRPIPRDLIAVARSGRFLSLLVLNNYEQGRITASDVADYLGIRIKHLGAIERRVFGAQPQTE
jgi:Zn-dependent peptidase ImmA (M78 family)/transcriptional regulator with XRE-family HTH domain